MKKRCIDDELWIAIKNNLGSYVEECVEMGANIESRNEKLQTPLIYACEILDYDMAGYFLAHQANVNEKDMFGKTALMYVCFNIDNDIAYYLVDKGADINARDKFGKTPLMYVCYGANEYNMEEAERLANYLISKGAGINIKDKEGRSLLDYAYSAGMVCLITYILSYYDYCAKYNYKNNNYYDLYMKDRVKFYKQKTHKELLKIIKERIERVDGKKRRVYNIEREPTTKKQRIIEKEG